MIECLFPLLALAYLAATDAPADPAGSGLTPADRDDLRRYAKDTWHSFAAMAGREALPADRLAIGRDGSATPSESTSPTDIAAYLWSVLAAERLGLIPAGEADERLDRTLVALGRLERHHGFFLI